MYVLNIQTLIQSHESQEPHIGPSQQKLKDGGYQRPEHLGRSLESCPEQVSMETESK